MRTNNTDISTLLSSLGTNNSALGSINLGDYASIKSGSYKKLLKAYYDEQSSDASSTAKTKTKKNSDASIDNTGLSTLKKDAENLKSSAEALSKDDLWKKTDGKNDMDKIANAVKSFAQNYNDVIEQSSKVTSKDVSSDTKYMSSLTSTLSNSLSKIGVTVGADGKLSVNEDTLKAADASDIKTLFTGKVSYGSQIADKAATISKDTIMNSSIYSSDGSVSSTLSGLFNDWM